MDLRRHSPRLALALLLCVATIGFVDRVVVNVLVEPIKAEFDLTDAQVSLMGLAFALLNVVAGILAARLAERVVRVKLIAFGTLLWSVATALCGAAGSWATLLAARMGVGLGEAIGLPGNQSVVSDYYPPQRRGFAISVLLLSPPLGAFLGFVGGGAVAQAWGWRWAFFAAAIPGIVIAALVWLFVAEPQRGRFDTESAEDVPPLRAVIARLAQLGSARNLVIGSAIAAMLGFATNFFVTSLLIRKFALPIDQAGLYAGALASLPAVLSVLLCGWLGDRWGARTPAAYALVPGALLLLGGPLLALGVTRESLPALLALLALATFCNFGFLGVTYAAIQNLMHPRMRASAAALLNGIYSVAGGVGPLLLGLLSDLLAGAGLDAGRALATALALSAGLYLWAALHYALAARHLGRELRSAAPQSNMSE